KLAGEEPKRFINPQPTSAAQRARELGSRAEALGITARLARDNEVEQWRSTVLGPAVQSGIGSIEPRVREILDAARGELRGGIMVLGGPYPISDAFAFWPQLMVEFDATMENVAGPYVTLQDREQKYPQLQVMLRTCIQGEQVWLFCLP